MATLTTPVRDHCAQLTRGLSPATGHPFGSGDTHTPTQAKTRSSLVFLPPPTGQSDGVHGCAQAYVCTRIGAGVENTDSSSDSGLWDSGAAGNA